MNDERYRRIHRFAEKYLKLYSSVDTSYIQLESVEFAQECESLGFEMDCLNSFERQYPGAGSNNETMWDACQHITDIDLLGSAIFSQWRYYTHWSQTNLADREVRQWFVYGFQRMLDLASSPTFQGDVEKMVIVSDDSAYVPPAPGQEIRQRLTMNRNGNVSLTRYFSGDFSQVPPTAGTRKMRRYKDKPTEKIMDYISGYFREYHDMVPAPDAGIWHIELMNTDGEKWSYRGSMDHDLEAHGYRLSNQTRKVLGIEFLWMFNGERS